MADWQERVQSLIIGFVFGYMVIKLISVISSFRAGNLRVERASDVDDSLLVPSEVVELGPGGELAAPLLATDEETEADGGDELENRANGGSSSSSDSDSDDEAGARPRGIDSAELPSVLGAGAGSEDVETKNDEDGEAEKDLHVGAKNDDQVDVKNGEQVDVKKDEPVEVKKDEEIS